jgi:hypothetical protein
MGRCQITLGCSARKSSYRARFVAVSGFNISQIARGRLTSGMHSHVRGALRQNAWGPWVAVCDIAVVNNIDCRTWLAGLLLYGAGYYPGITEYQHYIKSILE